MMLAACGVDSERDVKASRKLTFDEKRQDGNYFRILPLSAVPLVPNSNAREMHFAIHLFSPPLDAKN